MKQKLPEGFKPGETILQLKRRLDELGYSQSTVRRLDSVWRNFTQYWNDSAQTEFTLTTMQQFMDIRYGYAMGDKDRSHNIRRAMNMLWDFAWYNQVFRQSSANTAQFRPEYRDAFEGFLSHLRDIGYSKGSLDTFRSQLFQIENFLHGNGCPDIGAIDEEQIKGYTAFLYRDSPVTVERKLRMLKRLLEYAYNNGYIESLLSPVGPKVRVPRNTHLHTTFTREEINALLAAVDRSNPLGKRDYAILVLSACLGLRISDIVGLTFDEID